MHPPEMKEYFTRLLEEEIERFLETQAEDALDHIVALSQALSKIRRNEKRQN